MLKNTILALLVGLLGLFQSLSAIIIINQTDSVKIVEIEEAYRPAPDKPGDLAAPISFGYPHKKIKIAPHSSETFQLRTTPTVLLISVIKKTKKGKKITTNTVTTCYEPYTFQNQQEEYFNDDWGFVIHKPIDEKLGYGIKCLHPLVLAKITSLEELPEDLKAYVKGEANMSTRRY